MRIKLLFNGGKNKLSVLFIFLLSFILFQGSLVYAQDLQNDIVILKNGSKIKGKILEYIVDTSIKIQTSETNIMEIKMSEIAEIKKITDSEFDDKLDTPDENTTSFDNKIAGLSAQVGISIPQGDFSSTSSVIGNNSSAALTGYSISLSYCKYNEGINGSFALLTSFNKVDTEVLKKSTQQALPSSYSVLSCESGTISSFWGLGGINYSSNNDSDFRFFGSLYGGVVIGSVPDISFVFKYTSGYSSTTFAITQTTKLGVAICYGLSAGLLISKNFILGAYYFSASPEYEQSAGTSTLKVKLPISILGFTAGFVL